MALKKKHVCEYNCYAIVRRHETNYFCECKVCGGTGDAPGSGDTLDDVITCYECQGRGEMLCPNHGVK